MIRVIRILDQRNIKRLSGPLTVHIEKAFDGFDHNICISKLVKINSPLILKIIIGYYRLTREFHVKMLYLLQDSFSQETLDALSLRKIFLASMPTIS